MTLTYAEKANPQKARTPIALRRKRKVLRPVLDVFFLLVLARWAAPELSGKVLLKMIELVETETIL
jgi:hypothetical protein